MRLRARGRPPEEPDRETRREIQAVLALMGPHTGMPTLQWIFPELSRGALLEYQQRYRYAYVRNKRYLLHQLLWTRPGTVWAGDISDPPAPIESLYQKLTNIRDLASSHQLAALPSPDEQSVSVRMVLRSLEKWVGLPLVLKIDNGSCFRAEELKAWCREHGVLLLYSPPRTPEYNGAIEAGTGSIHARAHWQAARHDRPGEWTCDDVEAARLQANETARPRGLSGPTPDEMWAQRVPITNAERTAFLASYARLEKLERMERGIPEGCRLQHYEQAAIDRVAISRALIEGGFLLVRRRRITLPIWKRFEKKIS